MNLQRILAGLVLASVFVLGAVVGVAIDRHHYLTLAPAEISAEEMHAAAMAELRDEIGLDDEQIERVHAILASRQELVQELWEQLRPELQAAMQDVHEEIAELLRPEQLGRFHEWLQRRRLEAEHKGIAVNPH